MAVKPQGTVRLDHDSVVMGPLRVTFDKTLRIPEDGLHPLPPGLGAFPLRWIEDYLDTVPADSWERRGVMLPVYH